MGWGNIYRRRLKVFTVAIIIYLDYKAVQRRVKWLNRAKQDGIWERTHKRNAKRVLNLIIELEGLWVKLGQYLSTRADVLPEAYISLLKQLQDSLPPRPLEEVCQTIQKEMGKSMDDLFSNFVNEPIATASIAQVHRATLKDGREVVVKVQHEGIKEIILEDLKNAKSIVDWIAWAEPQYDFNPMIDEWCREAPKELDFNHEAENTRTVAKNLYNRMQDDTNDSHRVNVLIPEVIKSAEKVLILEYMDGIRLNDNETLEAFGIDKQKLVEGITRAYAHQIYVNGFFNGDPHPGNFLVSKEFPHRPILLDFGLTKLISESMKRALAKMLLACGEGNHVALLSSFAEMGLKLRLDMPEQVMEVATVFFRNSTPANEALENMKSLADQREKNMKILRQRMNLNEKEVKHFNPVDAFPGDAVIFMRVLNLLRGLSSTLNVRIIYLDIMRPFAESALQGSMGLGSESSTQWIFNSPVNSDVEAKLRQLLIKLGNDNKILGVQVCAYKDGNVVIDTAAGVLGKYDPRPVQLDSLFPVFSVSKGITAGMVQWLVDQGKLKLDENIANIWPDFGTNRKDQIKVHHVLNHTSGLHNAMADIMRTDPLLMCNWEECLQHIANSIPETEPGSQQLYHYLSFGWLCGGVIECASGKTFQQVLEEVIIKPLNIDGELYIGIPPGVESRLATLTPDMDDLEKFLAINRSQELPVSMRHINFSEMATIVPVLFNTLNVRRAIIPAANGHCSARALARYYAALATGGAIPPPHSSLSDPPLGSHVHIPKFPSLKTKRRDKKQTGSRMYNRFLHCKNDSGDYSTTSTDNKGYRLIENQTDDHAVTEHQRIYANPKIHEAFMGVGDYRNLVLPDGKFGLGFRRFESKTRKLTTFGHPGFGGSTGFCDIEHDFAIAVTVNKVSLGGVTRSIIQLVCSELNIPLPEEFSSFGEKGPDMQLNLNPNLNPSN